MPSYSRNGGWYAGDIYVEISGNGDIYYTTDGTEPGINSKRYEEPVRISDRSSENNKYASIKNISIVNDYVPNYLIDKCTVLKSVVIKEGIKSPVKSETYFVGLTGETYDRLPTLSISLAPDDLFDYEKGIYVTGKAYDDFYAENGYGNEYEYANYMGRGREWERVCEIEYYSEDHNKVFEQIIGLRIHGGSSRALNQKSFNLYAREEYDGNRSFLVDPLSGSEEKSTCNKLVLRSGGDVEVYITKMRDALMQSLASDRAVGTQKAKPCNVFINGEYWGLYNIQEAVNEDYICRYYGVDAKNIMLCKNGRSNREYPDAMVRYDEMIDYASQHDLSIEENYRRMEELIDIQSCIDYYAMEIYAANPDSIWNNLVAWRTISSGDGEYEDCRWRWVLLDLDESTGLKTEFSGVDIDSFVDGNYWGSILGEDKLFTSLVENPEFRKRFQRSFTEMLDNEFDYERTSRKLACMSELYRAADVQSQRRFRGDYVDDGYFPGIDYIKPYSEADFDNDVKVIDDFLRRRGGYISGFMKKDLGN
ncbi:MAG: CotH kinase family protein [Lachnospiraceae bacterium]|nr:CotH kinase family protein [Lachnospiraceae bacterium]